LSTLDCVGWEGWMGKQRQRGNVAGVAQTSPAGEKVRKKVHQTGGGDERTVPEDCVGSAPVDYRCRSRAADDPKYHDRVFPDAEDDPVIAMDKMAIGRAQQHVFRDQGGALRQGGGEHLLL